MFIVHCLLTTLLLGTPLLAQNVVTFEDQGWSSNQSLDSNFTIGNFLYSGNKNFYTNYGYNFDVYNVSIYFVFQNPSEDQFTITTLDNELFDLKSMAAYQVSELSTDTLIIEGWNGSSKEYTGTFSNITTWQILALNYDNINKAVIKLEPSGNGGLTDFNFDNFIFENPLPVELVSFTAVIKNNNTILLKWETATETNNYGFEIERNTENSDWFTIGFVKGQGNSISPKQYTFIDSVNYESVNYYYRLKQIDDDGTFKYSDVITVPMDVPDNYYLSQNYPNPFNPSTVINYQLPQASKVIIKIYDILGNEIITLVDGNKAAGSYSVTFDASNLASGIYIYELIAVDPSTGSGHSFVSRNKMMLIK